ncbi:hypothetical protein EJ04DRAFT_514180 [Polyplosphaeria fusca]|uniref:Uncharacterized protein n=1 Tax=Polyplosphaeria fusca TaxID=682080 RepID=A0A9P4QW64_9PLEO|nr:hypothetical protein EJ04DRAFT_514180 [Polyplosphaeria fusca]
MIDDDCLIGLVFESVLDGSSGWLWWTKTTAFGVYSAMATAMARLIARSKISKLNEDVSIVTQYVKLIREEYSSQGL